jgi:nitrogenase molybdenum-iron protein NifN
MKKPLQINPIKLSQPMGALLCFLGIKNTMPLMHGAQGCASFSKVFFTRHFSDPIAIQTSAVNDITAVIDGGDYSISESIKNITKKVQPDLVGLFTTGMTETKGDDIKGATYLLRDKQKMVYVHTPDFEGGLESGFALSIEAIIEQLVEPKEVVDDKKVLLIPNVNLTPLEVERIKEQIELFGFNVFALPDLSQSLDGHLAEKQGALSSGGISISEIEALGDSCAVISIGNSVKKSAEAILKKNSKIEHLHFDTVSGLVKADSFYEALMRISKVDMPHKSIVRWRQRLQDAMLDTHFALGSKRILVTAEPDQILSLVSSLNEVGAKIKTVVSPTKSLSLENLPCENIVIGDYEDIENSLDDIDLIIGNFHAERLAKKYKKALVIRGFPNYEEVGNQLKSDTLYEGSSSFLFEVANSFNHH